MKMRIPTVVVMAACVACGGKVDATGEQADGTGGTTANGGSGGSDPIGGSGGSAGIGGTAGIGGSAGIGGTAGIGVTSGASAAGAGGTVSSLCPLVVLGGDTFNASDGAASYDGPVAVPTPTGFVLGYWRGAEDGEAQNVRLEISDLGIQSKQTIMPMSHCSGGSRSNGVGAAWSESLGAGLMAVSTASCSPSDQPRMHVSNFDRHGAPIAEIEYELPSDVLLNPVKSVAAPQGSDYFWLAAMAGTEPFLYRFDGVAVQQDPPPQEIHQGTGTASFAQVAADATTLALLTDSDASGGMLYCSLLQASGYTVSLEMPPSSTSSLWTWNERAAVVSVVGASLDWIVFDGEGGIGGTLDAGPYGAVDIVRWGEQLVTVGAKPGSISLFRIPGVDGATEIGPAELSMTTPIDGYEGTRVAVTAARDSVVVAWLASTGVLPAGVSPGGYVVLGCGPS